MNAAASPFRARRIEKWSLVAAGLAASLLSISDAQGQISPTVTAEQASLGEAAFGRTCARCHGADLGGGEFGPRLLSQAFVRHWANRPVNDLLSFIVSTMPPGKAGSLSKSTYHSIVCYLLEKYGVQPGSKPLPSQVANLQRIFMPEAAQLEPYVRNGGVGLAPGVTLPKWDLRPNPAKEIEPISDAELKNPPLGSWLSWRRTQDDSGFSPLNQITTQNVQKLHLVWAFALPAGPNEVTPLVHDGVIFVSGYGDQIYAIDAVTGEELWTYHWELPKGVAPTVHRNIALYDNKVFFVTSNSHVVALNINTGELVWEQALVPSSVRKMTTGGPMVAEGVVMQGGIDESGGFVMGLDAESGVPIWTFRTIAQSSDPNSNSWNGVSPQKRSGGDVWTAGSYDSKQGLAYFGAAPTYDTEPLRKLSAAKGITNDALYTNATIALRPKTGELAWFFQHLPNDQWDLDWAFERQVVELPVNGVARRLVITAGKEAIYDALDARTGQFIFSYDLGIQNLISAVDPITGAKSVRPELIPGDGRTVTVCPNEAGGKSWLPASYDHVKRALYVSLVDVCMDLVPTRKGHGSLTSDVEPMARPQANSDGKYGRLQAIDFGSRRPIWTVRQRVPGTTGLLATAGGIVLSGDLDRWITAYSADSGETLWHVRLSDVPNAAPITFLANGRQYIAVVTGRGYGHTEAFFSLIPEIRDSEVQSSAIWVFALSD